MNDYTPIRNLKLGMKDLTLKFIILDVSRPNFTKDGKEVRTVKVADKSGSVNLSLWDDLGKLITSGDIIRMTKGYTNVWKGQLTLYVGKGGEFQKMGDFCLVFSEVPFLSEYNAEMASMAPGGQQQAFQRNNGQTQQQQAQGRLQTNGQGQAPGWGGGGGGVGSGGGVGRGGMKGAKDK